MDDFADAKTLSTLGNTKRGTKQTSIELDVSDKWKKPPQSEKKRSRTPPALLKRTS